MVIRYPVESKKQQRFFSSLHDVSQKSVKIVMSEKQGNEAFEINAYYVSAIRFSSELLGFILIQKEFCYTYIVWFAFSSFTKVRRVFFLHKFKFFFNFFPKTSWNVCHKKRSFIIIQKAFCYTSFDLSFIMFIAVTENFYLAVRSFMIKQNENTIITCRTFIRIWYYRCKLNT